MEPPLVFLTGFGPFESVDDNPSGALARTLDGDPGIRGVELPVTFAGSAEVRALQFGLEENLAVVVPAPALQLH